MDTDEFISETMRRVASSVTVTPGEMLTAPLRRPRRTAFVAVAAAAVVVGLVAVGIGRLGWHRSTSADVTSSPTTSTAPGDGCLVDYPAKTLPSWARTGFTPPTQAVPYVLGERGDIAAVVWATHHPLSAPPSEGKGNKILWVARVGAGDGSLRIRATLEGTGQTVTRTVAPAPGPSDITLPSPGCWSLDLTWGTHQDHLVLGYAAP